MNTLVISSYFEHVSPTIRNFLEALTEKGLCYRASSLHSVFESAEEISNALYRAMLVCNRARIPLREHFNIIYVADDQGVRTDWKLSRFAFCLVVLNGNSALPLVGRMQLELLRHLL